MGYIGKEPRKDGGSLTLGATLDVNGNEVVLDADADSSITADTDDRIDFKTGGTDRLQVQSTSGNNVVIADGLTLTDGNLVVASGHGIDFSATSDLAGKSSELLDDYEEGTYTVTATASTSGTITPILVIPLDSTPAKSSLKNLNVRPPAKSIPKSVLGEL